MRVYQRQRQRKQREEEVVPFHRELSDYIREPLMWPSRMFSSWFGGDDEVFSDTLSRMRNRLSKEMSVWPRCDVTEDDQHYTLSADVPGVRDKDLKVRIDTRDNALVIDGSRKSV
ncbi:MAG: hypothetical protein MHM6MM_009531, partial [Cercozoa sp. M6MM]